MAVLRWVDGLKMIPQIYVDVGCYHPIHWSNTLLLHKRGWKGVNVDLDKSRITEFERLRPGDYNVLAAVSDRSDARTPMRYCTKRVEAMCCLLR